MLIQQHQTLRSENVSFISHISFQMSEQVSSLEKCLLITRNTVVQAALYQFVLQTFSFHGVQPRYHWWHNCAVILQIYLRRCLRNISAHRAISTVWQEKTSEHDLIPQYTMCWPAFRIWPCWNLRTTPLTWRRVKSIQQRSIHPLCDHQLIKHTSCALISKGREMMSLGSIKDGKRRSF